MFQSSVSQGFQGETSYGGQINVSMIYLLLGVPELLHDDLHSGVGGQVPAGHHRPGRHEQRLGSHRGSVPTRAVNRTFHNALRRPLKGSFSC